MSNHVSILVCTARPRTSQYQLFRWMHDGGSPIIISRTRRGKVSVLWVHRTHPKPGLVVEKLRRSEEPGEDLERIAKFYTRNSMPAWCVDVFDGMGVELK